MSGPAEWYNCGQGFTHDIHTSAVTLGWAEGGTGRFLEFAKWNINASTGDFQTPCISCEQCTQI